MCVLTLNHSPCDSGGTVEDTIVEFLCLGHMCAIREKLCLIETTGISGSICSKYSLLYSSFYSMTSVRQDILNVGVLGTEL